MSKKKYWGIFEEGNLVKHVIPINDLQDHEDESTWENDGESQWPVCECTCKPHRESVPKKGTWVIIHKSFDGREGIEWANLLLKSNK